MVIPSVIRNVTSFAENWGSLGLNDQDPAGVKQDTGGWGPGSPYCICKHLYVISCVLPPSMWSVECRKRNVSWGGWIGRWVWVACRCGRATGIKAEHRLYRCGWRPAEIIALLWLFRALEGKSRNVYSTKCADWSHYLGAATRCRSFTKGKMSDKTAWFRDTRERRSPTAIISPQRGDTSPPKHRMWINWKTNVSSPSTLFWDQDLSGDKGSRESMRLWLVKALPN
jgi:hypothetical protein